MSKHPDTSSIASAFSACLEAYRDFYLVLARDERTATETIPLPEVADEYGRLKVWGANTEALRTGRGSLDDKLRNDGRLKSMILTLLRELTEDLQRGATHKQTKPDPGLSVHY